MTAQFLYDLQTLTGFVSGQGLQNLFHALGLGYCPKGQVEIDLEEAEKLCPELTAELDSNEWHRHVARYTGLEFKEMHLDRVPLRDSHGGLGRIEKELARFVGETEDLAWAGASV